MNSDIEGIYKSNANRKEMNGGWGGDPRSVFVREGRTADESAVYDYVRMLLTWRKRTPVVQYGKLKHFKPQDGIYVYFRYDDSACVMVAVNANDADKVLDTQRFNEMLSSYHSGLNVETGEAYGQLDKISLKRKSTQIIELRKH